MGYIPFGISYSTPTPPSAVSQARGVMAAPPIWGGWLPIVITTQEERTMKPRTQNWVRIISAIALLGMLLSACFLAPLPQAQAAPLASVHPCTIDPNSVYGDIGKK